MRIFKIILFAAGLVLTILFHERISMLGLNLRLSFTLSKILPYAIELFFTTGITLSLYMQVLSQKELWIRRVVSIAVFFACCGAAFSANPIYEGDFNNTYQIVSISGESEDALNSGLIMVALPNCPYCYKRLEEMNFISEIYPELPITVYVINKDTAAVENYKSKSENQIKVDFFPTNLLGNSALNTGQYPTIMYKSKTESNKLTRWFNDNFGYPAWDYVLEQH